MGVRHGVRAHHGRAKHSGELADAAGGSGRFGCFCEWVLIGRMGGWIGGSLLRRLEEPGELAGLRGLCRWWDGRSSRCRSGRRKHASELARTSLCGWKRFRSSGGSFRRDERLVDGCRRRPRRRGLKHARKLARRLLLLGRWNRGRRRRVRRLKHARELARHLIRRSRRRWRRRSGSLKHLGELTSFRLRLRRRCGWWFHHGKLKSLSLPNGLGRGFRTWRGTRRSFKQTSELGLRIGCCCGLLYGRRQYGGRLSPCRSLKHARELAGLAWRCGLLRRWR